MSSKIAIHKVPTLIHVNNSDSDKTCFTDLSVSESNPFLFTTCSFAFFLFLAALAIFGVRRLHL